ncbi:hypothetical protein CYMTET_28387 [Cymbomonas tetramitiformis]|uniref:Mutator-like transposase domain-containing protein n=1 Tax=Cymbomonas tetramitiformis TaxID=36881 RepID=A0AAE0KVY5_9CHLO|nr:hypothetical protein CYMTET_28387 [Cymbomonas tetramitiformis]
MLPAVSEGTVPHIEDYGLASVIHMACTVCEHTTTLESSQRMDGDDRRTAYEINTSLHVLGEQNAGLAPAKVEKLFTSMGIEYHLHKTNHGKLQKVVGATVETLAKESCKKAFEDEVVASSPPLSGGTAQRLWPDGTTYVNLGATGDCAWPTRGSGHAYASFCGGFILMGALNKKIVSAAIFSQQCSTCESVEKLAEKEKVAPVYPAHDCFRGCRGIMAESDPLWRGSSKAMEPKGALCTALGLGKHYLKCDELQAIIARVRYFTADEDSNMIAALNDPRLMPEWLRPVDKLSDPNHMQKIQYKLLEALRKAEKWSKPSCRRRSSTT